METTLCTGTTDSRRVNTTSVDTMANVVCSPWRQLKVEFRIWLQRDQFIIQFLFLCLSLPKVDTDSCPGHPDHTCFCPSSSTLFWENTVNIGTKAIRETIIHLLQVQNVIQIRCEGLGFGKQQLCNSSQKFVFTKRGQSP